MGKKLPKIKKKRNDTNLNKSNEVNKNYEIKIKKDPIDISNRKKEMIKKIKEGRKNELYEFLFSNVPKENNLIKNKINNISSITNPILPLITKFNHDSDKISSNLIFLSKDIIIVLTYNILNANSTTLEIKDLKIKLDFGNKKEYNGKKYILKTMKMKILFQSLN